MDKNKILYLAFLGEKFEGATLDQDELRKSHPDGDSLRFIHEGLASRAVDMNDQIAWQSDYDMITSAQRVYPQLVKWVLQTSGIDGAVGMREALATAVWGLAEELLRVRRMARPGVNHKSSEHA
jgi:hypothetical protein